MLRGLALGTLYKWMRSISLSLRLVLVFSLLLIVLTLLGWWSYRSVAELSVNGPDYQRLEYRHALSTDLTPPTLFVIETQLACLELATVTDAATQAHLISRLTELRQSYQAARDVWSVRPIDARLSDLLLVRGYAAAQSLYSVAYQKLIPAVRGGHKDDIVAAVKEIRGHFEVHRALVEQAFLVSSEIERQESDWMVGRTVEVENHLMRALLAAAALILLMGVLMRASIIRPLQHALAIALQIAAGDFRLAPQERFDDEPGRLLSALVAMCKSLDEVISQLEHANHISDQAMEVSRAGTWTIDLTKKDSKTHLSPRAQVIFGEFQIGRAHV